jgi:hypothetical protein
MKTLREKRVTRGTTVHFLNAFDHDMRVFADFAGDVIMDLPDLVCNV